jgi:hypothetical protein
MRTATLSNEGFVPPRQWAADERALEQSSGQAGRPSVPEDGDIWSE